MVPVEAATFSCRRIYSSGFSLVNGSLEPEPLYRRLESSGFRLKGSPYLRQPLRRLGGAQVYYQGVSSQKMGVMASTPFKETLLSNMSRVGLIGPASVNQGVAN